MASEHLDAAVELFTEILDLKEIFRLPGTSFLQAETGSVAIQLIARPALRAQEKKQLSHVGFVSDNPERDRERIREFLASRGFVTTLGQWSPRELWVDAPEIFYDFVIEVFDRTLLEEVMRSAT